MLRTIPIFVLATACRTVPVTMPLALESASASPPPHDIAVLPAACSGHEPSHWGDEARVRPGDAPCSRELVDAIDRRVRDGLTARGYRIVPLATPGAGTVDVAVSSWQLGARVTLVLRSTDPRPHVATCQSARWSGAAATLVEAEPVDVAISAARCAVAAIAAPGCGSVRR
ncbi:MAG TPA: hypothetical protein VFQ53_24720 [Kofleriaceae bacterium]|nr:hypothetical protein [Kofleriaceae bacterium]